MELRFKSSPHKTNFFTSKLGEKENHKLVYIDSVQKYHHISSLASLWRRGPFRVDDWELQGSLFKAMAMCLSFICPHITL